MALGVALFVGLSWSSDGVKLAAHQEMEEGHFHDIEITYPYGFTDENIEEIAAIDGVDEVEGSRNTCAFIRQDGVNNQIKIYQMSERIDTLIDVRGELPREDGEIAVETTWATSNDISIGDTLVFTHDDEENDCMKALTTDTFKVTAIVSSPCYIGRSTATYGSSPDAIAIDGLMFCPKSTFKDDAFSGCSSVLIRSKALRGMNTFTAEYEDADEAFRDSITEAVADIAEDRYYEIYDAAEDRLFELDKQLEEALTKIANGEAEISDAKARLAQAQRQVDAGERKIAATEKKLKALKADIRLANADVNKVKKIADKVSGFIDAEDYEGLENYAVDVIESGTLDKLAKDAKKLANKYISDEKLEKELIDELKNIALEIEELIEQDELDYDALEALLGKYKDKIESAWNEFISAPDKAEAKISKAKSKLRYTKELIAAGNREVAKNVAKLADAKAKYQEGLDAEEEIREAMDKLRMYDCSISPRSYNGGVSAVNVIGDTFLKIRFSMAGLFLIVGLLVCYSAVSRLVYDQMVSIGTKKALGLSSREITISYLAYSVIAVLAGSIVGLVLGCVALEPIVYHGVTTSYILYAIKLFFSAKAALVGVGLELAFILAATWFACANVLKRNAIELLGGPEPPSGKHRFYEKWKIWQKLSLMSKTAINNCLTDTRRVVATLIGVAGCTALIVCAVMLNDNINQSFFTQYRDYFKFDCVAYYEEQEDADTGAKIQSALKDEGIDSTAVASRICAITMPDGFNMFTHIFVPMQDNYRDFVVTKPLGETNCSPDEGVWLNISYSSKFGSKAGDTVRVIDLKGQEHEVVIDGFFDCYQTRLQLMMSPDKYEEIFGEKPESNSIFMNTDEADLRELEGKLSETEGFISLNKYKENSRVFFNAFTSVSKALVAIYLVMSLVMAFLVLLNLYTMCIQEKRSELIVMMINGYDSKRVKKYIYGDAIVLTIVGIILGLILGTVMGAASIHSFESSASYFIKGFNWKAATAGTLVSAVLSALMMMIALRKVDKFELSDINK